MSSAGLPSWGLKENERILWKGNKSLLSYLGSFILAFIVILLSVIPIVGFIFLSWGLLLSLYLVISSLSHKYYLTNIRIVHEHTLFGRRIEETTLDKVTDVVYQQGLFGRIVNVGSIRFHTAGTGFPGITFDGVPDPVLVREAAINAKDAYFANPAPTRAPPSVGAFCEDCGKPIRPTAKFCGSCGAPV